MGVVDQSSFAKFSIRGVDALALLQRVAGADLDVPVGKIVYTQLLNVRGGIEADVTVTRRGPEDFYLVTGSGFGRHDVTFLLQHAPQDGSVVIDDVTSSYGVLNVCGPRSRDLLQSLSGDDLSDEAFPYMTARETDVGWAPVLALRATYVGELGWELHVPTEYVADVYEKVLAAGEPHGLRDVGYRAVDTLRVEKHFLAWAGDIRSDNNPYEAGLGFAVRPDKPGLLAGPALQRVRQDGPRQRLCWFTTEAPDVMHGGELLAHPASGTEVSVRSAAFGHTVGRTVFSAYLPAEVAATVAEDTALEVEIAGRRHPATRHRAPLHDPQGLRVRS